MKLNSRKVIAYFITTTILTTIYIVTLLKSPYILKDIGGTIIFNIVLMALGFIGGNSFDKYMISKHYKKELDDKNIGGNQ
jgi:hypothetical protein